MINGKYNFIITILVFGDQLIKNRPENATREIEEKFLLSIFLTLR